MRRHSLECRNMKSLQNLGGPFLLSHLLREAERVILT